MYRWLSRESTAEFFFAAAEFECDFDLPHLAVDVGGDAKTIGDARVVAILLEQSGRLRGPRRGIHEPLQRLEKHRLFEQALGKIPFLSGVWDRETSLRQ